MFIWPDKLDRAEKCDTFWLVVIFECKIRSVFFKINNIETLVSESGRVSHEYRESGRVFHNHTIFYYNRKDVIIKDRKTQFKEAPVQNFKLFCIENVPWSHF